MSDEEYYKITFITWVKAKSQEDAIVWAFKFGGMTMPLLSTHAVEKE